MEELKKRIILLLNKSEWTQDDKRWLLEYLEHTETRELHALMLEEFNKRKLPAEILDKSASEKILKGIHEKIAVRKSPARSLVFMLHRKMVAAAVVGFCIVSTCLIADNKWGKNTFNKQAHAKPGIGKGLKNDVAPGGNKAVLTLADGSTVLLDDAKNGILAQQGATKVLKTDGKLAYNSAKAGAGETLYNTIATPRGGEYQIMLPDGSQVWLNAESSLKFPTSFKYGNERRVEVTGEAYFEVAKNAAMPFIVKVNSSEVKVLGTHFNIMAYGEERLLKTTLLEGSIQFSSGTNQITLKPGQQSQLVTNGGLTILNEVNLEEVMAWKNGMFHFEKTDVEMMMRQISRWYDVEVVYQHPVTNEKFIADIPRNTNLSDVLKALELTGKIQFNVEGRKVMVR